MLPRWREKDLSCLDQVANAKDSQVDLTPVSEAPADAVKTAWAPWLTGQAVPMIFEAYDAEPIEPCDR